MLSVHGHVHSIFVKFFPVEDEFNAHLVVVTFFTYFLANVVVVVVVFFFSLQLITNAELEESPLYVPVHHFEGLISSTRFFDSFQHTLYKNKRFTT